VLVGDLGALDPTQMITDSFGTMPVPKDPLPARPDLGKPSFKNKGFALSRSIFRSMFGPGGPAIVVASLRPGAPKPFSSEGLGTEIQGELLDLLAGQRFAERDDKDKLPYDAINVLESSSIVDSQGTVEGPALVVHCDKDHWRDALTGAERELRRMTEKGFTDDELKKAYFQHQKTLTPRPEFPPPHSLEFVQSLLQACNGGYVPMKDRDEKDARRVASRKFNDVKAMNQSFKDLWTKGELVIFSSGLELGADPAADLLATWEAAKATSLDQPMPVSTDATAKADKPADGAEPGAAPDADTAAADKDKKEPAKKADPKAFAYAVPDVVKDATATANRMDDLKVVDLAFQNGVKATYRKKMDEGNFSFGRFEVRVGEGMLALDPSKRAVAAVATRVFLASGLAKNDWDTVNAAGGGAVHFEVEGDALVFSGVALGSDPKRAFEVICAYLTDPGWRQDAFDEFKKKLPEEFKKEGEAKENLNTLLSKFRDQLVSAEPRLADPDQAALEAVTFDEVKSFLQSQLDGPVAVTAVGIDGAKFERGVFSTFAKLPKRRAAQSYDARRAIAPLKTGLKEKHDVETGQQSALIHMIYPATDAIDPAASRRLELLEDIVMDRLRIEIREKRAGAYSPNANVWGSDTWKGLGWVALDVQVDPAKVDEMIKACALTMETLGTKGVTQPELDRLRTAHLGDYEQSLKEDGLWFHAMQEGHARPEVYDELRNFKAPYEKITVADMNALCKAVFVKGHEDVFVAIPKK
jgi:zinc protease